MESKINVLGNWNISCTLFNQKATLTGKLEVTNENLIFQTKGLDTSSNLLEIISKYLISQSSQQKKISIDIFKQWLKNDHFILPKSEIQSISSNSSFFNKRVILDLSDNTTIVFNNGFSDIKKLYLAISNKVI